MGKSKTLILIDGHALAFRQFYALERTAMHNSEGTPTWAVYGFFKAIFDILRNEKFTVDALAVTFDVSHQTFRVDAYEDYKSNRVAMPDDMQIQMDLIYEGLRAFSIPVYSKEGFEADDVIGTISKRACELGHKIYILTGDQDSFQLIDKDACVKVILPYKGELVEFGWDEVYRKLGVYPSQIIDYKALRGDTSDNIPGVKGIGEKTAQKLLNDYKSLDNIYSNIDNIKENSVREKLKNGVDIAKMSKYLATIVRDVDIDFNFDSACITPPDIQKVNAFLKKMQFLRFLKDIDGIMKLFNSRDNLCVEQNTPVFVGESQSQLSLFSDFSEQIDNKINFISNVITNVDNLEKLYNKLCASKLFSFNFLADFNHSKDFKLYGVSFSLSGDAVYSDSIKLLSDEPNFDSYFIPFDLCIENSLSAKSVLEKLAPVFVNSDIKKIVNDLKLGYEILNFYNIELSGVVFDTYLASYIYNTQKTQTIENQTLENLSHNIQECEEFATLKKKNILLTNDNIQKLADCENDKSSAIILLSNFWQKHLSEKEMNLLLKTEMPLSAVLSDMEIAGVSIDIPYLNELSVYMADKINDLEAGIYSIAGCEFNINSPKQVSEVLFEKLNLVSPKKRGKNKNSTNAEILESLAQDYEIAGLILQHRKFSKLKSTYVDAFPELVSKIDGRIHTTYNQTMTSTGRLSSSNPNLQNIPVRTEEGNKLRQAFIPNLNEKGYILSADYSQIELRLLAHISKDENLINAFNSGQDIHTITASKVFGVDVSSVTKDMRYKSKAVNFGIIYGQSRYGLAKALKITPVQAQEFIDKYFETYPNIKLYMDSIVDFAEDNGYVETIFGRKRYLKTELSSSNAMIREFAKRAAINHPIQGTAADLMKFAMIDLYKKFKENNIKSKIIIQVHDELVLEVYDTEIDKVKELVISSMELSQPLSVPLVVDVNIGETWQEK